MEVLGSLSDQKEIGTPKEEQQGHLAVHWEFPETKPPTKERTGPGTRTPDPMMKMCCSVVL